jgi:hypothetical protein
METVGELRKHLERFPDDMPLLVESEGYLWSVTMIGLVTATDAVSRERYGVIKKDICVLVTETK